MSSKNGILLHLMKSRSSLAVPVLMLVLAALACGGRVFGDLRVYSANPGPASEFYDPVGDRILADDVWVFRPDGTFDAIVNVDEQRSTLSGTYEGDNAGHVLYLFLDTDGDGETDASLILDDENFSIVWQREREGGELIYYLAP